jgi:hypothetical protein
MSDSNTEQLSRVADSLAILPATDADRRHAKAVAYDLAARDKPNLTDDLEIGRHALLMLAALGLVDPFMPLAGIPDAPTHLSRNGRHVKRVGATTHGTGVGFAWHRDQRVPLCAPCKGWERDNQPTTEETDPQPCAVCGRPALLRHPVTQRPHHKVCDPDAAQPQKANAA